MVWADYIQASQIKEEEKKISKNEEDQKQEY